jgi:glycogenin glucosyltransferase
MPLPSLIRFVTNIRQVTEYTSGRYSPASSPTGEEPFLTAEAGLSEEREIGEELGQGRIEPTPTAEQRRFSAPHVEWDATR